MLTQNSDRPLCGDSYHARQADVCLVMNTQREMLLGQVVLALLFVIAILLRSLL